MSEAKTKGQGGARPTHKQKAKPNGTVAAAANMPVGRRMEQAVAEVLSGAQTQSEAARRWNVSRPRVNVNVKAAKAKMDAQAARSEASMKERAGEVAVLPEGVRGVGTFEEFWQRYFSNTVCPGCGVSHELPGFHREIIKAVDGPDKTVLINVPPFHKLWVEEPLLTTTGWKTMGTVAEGDFVFAMDGTPTEVVGKSPVVMDDTYVVHLSGGTEIRAGADHRWWVHPKKAKPCFVSTTELKPGYHRIPLAQPVQFPEADLPIDPYTLGAWLGDGDSAGGRITVADPEIMERIYSAGYGRGAVNGIGHGVLGLRKQLRLAGLLKNKHIPEVYFTASIEQRMELLRGLMDTDGTCNSPRAGSVASFTNTNERLADDTASLIASLGWLTRRFKTPAKLYGIEHGTAYITTFLAERSRSPFHLQRKTDRLAEHHPRGNYNVVQAVERTACLPCQCIRVAHESETFLAGRDLVVTGNSKSSLITIWWSIYQICKDPNVRIAVVSKTQRFAEEMLQSIKFYLTNLDLYETCEGNLIDDFGPFYSPTVKWAANSFYVAGRTSAERQPTVGAYGIGGQIYGTRWDIMIFDDVADLESQANPENVEKNLRWATQEAANRVGRNGKLRWVGTRVSAGDIYSRLAALPGVKTIRFPCIMDEHEQTTLWPEHYSFAEADAQRASMDPAAFQLVYQNVDTPGVGASFTPDALDRCHDPSRPLGHADPSWALVMGLDPGGSGSQSGFTAFVLLGVDLETGKMHLVDVVAHKNMKAPQMKDQLFAWADTYPGIRECRIERNGLQSYITQDQEILAYMAKRSIKVVPHFTGNNKWDPNYGVESLAPMMFNGQFSTPWADPAARNKVRTWEEQFIAFPMGKVTDQVMATWFAWLAAKDLFQRNGMPMFSERMKVPAYVRNRRRVLNFGNGTARYPGSETPIEAKKIRIANMSGVTLDDLTDRHYAS